MQENQDKYSTKKEIKFLDGIVENKNTLHQRTPGQIKSALQNYIATIQGRRWDDDYCFGFMLEVVELAIAEEREVMEKYRKACKGLPDGAIDGGWTALGMSTYTRALEDALNNIICLETDRLANAYVIAGEALALRFHKISTEEREAFGWRDIASAPKDGSHILLGMGGTDEDCEISTLGWWQEEVLDGQDYMGNDAGFVDHEFSSFHPGRSFGADKYQYKAVQPTHWKHLPAAPKDEVSE